jgi:hypothetical protein
MKFFAALALAALAVLANGSTLRVNRALAAARDDAELDAGLDAGLDAAVDVAAPAADAELADADLAADVDNSNPNPPMVPCPDSMVKEMGDPKHMCAKGIICSVKVQFAKEMVPMQVLCEGNKHVLAPMPPPVKGAAPGSGAVSAPVNPANPNSANGPKPPPKTF